MRISPSTFETLIEDCPGTWISLKSLDLQRPYDVVQQCSVISDSHPSEQRALTVVYLCDSVITASADIDTIATWNISRKPQAIRIESRWVDSCGINLNGSINVAPLTIQEQWWNNLALTMAQITICQRPLSRLGIEQTRHPVLKPTGSNRPSGNEKNCIQLSATFWNCIEPLTICQTMETQAVKAKYWLTRL